MENKPSIKKEIRFPTTLVNEIESYRKQKRFTSFAAAVKDLCAKGLDRHYYEMEKERRELDQG
jgi:hypothetical protein